MPDKGRSPTAELVLEVLAARYRLGEHRWPISRKFKRTLDALTADGLVTYTSGPMGTFYVALTAAGVDEALHSPYTPPGPVVRENGSIDATLVGVVPSEQEPGSTVLYLRARAADLSNVRLHIFDTWTINPPPDI